MIRLSKSQVLLIHDQVIAETGGASNLKVILCRMAFTFLYDTIIK